MNTIGDLIAAFRTSRRMQRVRARGQWPGGGVFWGSFAAREPLGNRAHAARILDLVAEGTLRPHVDRVVPFARSSEALERLERRQVLGKVVLVP
jgi:NADPH:quinone reductase-like Zn-dependent oxidoreductase